MSLCYVSLHQIQSNQIVDSYKYESSDIKPEHTRDNDIQHNDILYNNNKQNDRQHKDTPLNCSIQQKQSSGKQ